MLNLNRKNWRLIDLLTKKIRYISLKLFYLKSYDSAKSSKKTFTGFAGSISTYGTFIILSKSRTWKLFKGCSEVLKLSPQGWFRFPLIVFLKKYKKISLWGFFGDISAPQGRGSFPYLCYFPVSAAVPSWETHPWVSVHSCGTGRS
jgi:hypothetical protein